MSQSLSFSLLFLVSAATLHTVLSFLPSDSIPVCFILCLANLRMKFALSIILVLFPFLSEPPASATLLDTLESDFEPNRNQRRKGGKQTMSASEEMGVGKHICCDKQEVKKGLWSREEDEKLINYISVHGITCWSSVPKLAGLQRCGKSCRSRWVNYLRPGLKRGTLSDTEKRLIVNLHKLKGNRWSEIARHLPGRTDIQIKNYWKSIKKVLPSHLNEQVPVTFNAPTPQPMNPNITYNDHNLHQIQQEFHQNLFRMIKKRFFDDPAVWLINSHTKSLNMVPPSSTAGKGKEVVIDDLDLTKVKQENDVIV